MPRFFFDFREGNSLSPDDEGIEFASLEEAYLEAFRSAQDIAAERLRERCDPFDCAFTITDAAGQELIVLPFKEILDGRRQSTLPQENENRPTVGFAEVLGNAKRMVGLSAELSKELRETRQAISISRSLL
jgi:hypothetical protein